VGWLDRLTGKAKSDDRAAGQLGYHGLRDWWDQSFSLEDQRLIEERYQPMGGGIASLTEGRIESTSQTAAGLLWGLSSWFNKPGERRLARRMLAKAEEIATDVVDRHFVFSQLIDVAYPERDRDPTAMSEAMRACEAQIALSREVMAAMRAEHEERERMLERHAREAGTRFEPHEFRVPSHRGFTQLSIIREKSGDIAAAIASAEQAAADGWSGDWAKRIARLRTRLSR
jgi:hypothetical protein